jgi:hypothetical protein
LTPLHCSIHTSVHGVHGALIQLRPSSRWPDFGIPRNKLSSPILPIMRVQLASSRTRTGLDIPLALYRPLSQPSPLIQNLTSRLLVRTPTSSYSISNSSPRILIAQACRTGHLSSKSFYFIADTLKQSTPTSPKFSKLVALQICNAKFACCRECYLYGHLIEWPHSQDEQDSNPLTQLCSFPFNLPSRISIPSFRE